MGVHVLDLDSDGVRVGAQVSGGNWGDLCLRDIPHDEVVGSFEEFHICKRLCDHDREMRVFSCSSSLVTREGAASTSRV